MYARNILGRLNSIQNPTTAFNADPTQQGNSPDGDTTNMGIMILGMIVMIFIMMVYRMNNRTKKPESKV